MNPDGIPDPSPGLREATLGMPFHASSNPEGIADQASNQAAIEAKVALWKMENGGTPCSSDWVLRQSRSFT